MKAWLAVLLVPFGALLGAWSDGNDGGASAVRPNIVWIVAEDMNFELGAFGDSLARTPNIDRLADEGVRFTNAFATAGTCAPSSRSPNASPV